VSKEILKKITDSRYYPGIDMETLIVEGNKLSVSLKQSDPIVPLTSGSYGYKFCAFLYIRILI
jgi:hypothetical protein